jgi:hypothetical protein
MRIRPTRVPPDWVSLTTGPTLQDASGSSFAKRPNLRLIGFIIADDEEGRRINVSLDPVELPIIAGPGITIDFVSGSLRICST